MRKFSQTEFSMNVSGHNRMISNRTKTETKVTEKIQNNKIFVYKIIHDLRHPTQAVADSLKRLFEETKTSKAKLGHKLICQKKLTYLGHKSNRIAVKVLSDFIGAKKPNSTSRVDDNSSF